MKKVSIHTGKKNITLTWVTIGTESGLLLSDIAKLTVRCRTSLGHYLSYYGVARVTLSSKDLKQLQEAKVVHYATKYTAIYPEASILKILRLTEDTQGLALYEKFKAARDNVVTKDSTKDFTACWVSGKERTGILKTALAELLGVHPSNLSNIAKRYGIQFHEITRKERMSLGTLASPRSTIILNEDIDTFVKVVNTPEAWSFYTNMLNVLRSMSPEKTTSAQEELDKTKRELSSVQKELEALKQQLKNTQKPKVMVRKPIAWTVATETDRMMAGVLMANRNLHPYNSDFHLAREASNEVTKSNRCTEAQRAHLTKGYNTVMDILISNYTKEAK